MRFCKEFEDFELIDVNGGERLERFGNVILVRPDPQIIWKSSIDKRLWNRAQAVYKRSASGGGYWEMLEALPESWQIKYKEFIFNLKPMGFKHMGIFPEQAVNWEFLRKIIKPGMNVLNLFAYTGAASVVAAKFGAKVTHVDASRGMVAFAKENAASNGISNIRWIVEDCLKFVHREIRRKNKYDGIIMDPPSYGRGPNGEVWKLEDNLQELIVSTGKLMNEEAKFFMLNTYTAGISGEILKFLCRQHLPKGQLFYDEIGLQVTKRDLLLPCGSTTIWTKDSNGKYY